MVLWVELDCSMLLQWQEMKLQQLKLTLDVGSVMPDGASHLQSLVQQEAEK